MALRKLALQQVGNYLAQESRRQRIQEGSAAPARRRRTGGIVGSRPARNSVNRQKDGGGGSPAPRRICLAQVIAIGQPLLPVAPLIGAGVKQ